MNDIKELKEAIARLESWPEKGNRDWENCVKWLKELLEVKEDVYDQAR